MNKRYCPSCFDEKDKLIAVSKEGKCPNCGAGRLDIGKGYTVEELIENIKEYIEYSKSEIAFNQKQIKVYEKLLKKLGKKK